MQNILFVHGILGKPDYFDFLLPHIPGGYRSSAILLEGHGADPQAFGRASMTRWRRQVAEAADELRKGGERLVIAAHSMGTLFAIDNAVRGKADGLFLLNPPLTLRVTRRLFTTPFKVMTGNIGDSRTHAAQAAYSISEDPNLLHYVRWIPRYLELFGEIRRTRAIVKNLAVPTRVFLSAHDEMVSPRGASLFPRNPGIITTLLPDSGHYYYPESDAATITRAFTDFLSAIHSGLSVTQV